MFGCQNPPITQLLSIPIILLSAVLPVSFSTDANSVTSVPSKNPGRDEEGKCELIGTFSLMTQAVLGLLCLSSLLVKRYYEFPVRRSWPVWSFDVSKQLIGALGVHIFNVILSIIKTRKVDDSMSAFRPGKGPRPGSPEDGDTSDDPCDWYFLSIVFDCTIGVYILYLVFQSMNKICKKYFHITHIDSGSYGPNPNKPSTTAFLKQLAVYFTSLMITKFLIYGIVECFETQLLWFTSHVLLLWLDEYPDEFEIVIVMFVVPIFMNCLQLILIDNFIRNQSWLKVNSKVRHNHHASAGETDSMVRNDIGNYIAEREEEDLVKNREDDNSDSSNSTYVSGDNQIKNYGSFNAV